MTKGLKEERSTFQQKDHAKDYSIPCIAGTNIATITNTIQTELYRALSSKLVHALLKRYYCILSIHRQNLSGFMDNNGREICKFLQSLGAMSGTSFYIEIRGDSFLRLPHSYQLPLLILLLLLSNIKVFGLTTFSQTSSNSFFSMKVTKTSQTYKTYEIIASYISVFVA